MTTEWSDGMSLVACAVWPVDLNEQEANSDIYGSLQKVSLVHRHVSVKLDTLHYLLAFKYVLAMIDPFSVCDCNYSIFILEEQPLYRSSTRSKHNNIRDSQHRSHIDSCAVGLIVFVGASYFSMKRREMLAFRTRFSAGSEESRQGSWKERLRHQQGWSGGAGRLIVRGTSACRSPTSRSI